MIQDRLRTENDRDKTGMDILIIGNSSLAQRRIIPAMVRLPGIKEISIASSNSVIRPEPNDQKIIKFFDSYEKAFLECKAELFYISTVNSRHAELADKALDLGRHVIVDKPAFLTLDTSQRLVAKAENKKLLLAEATVFLDHPIYSEISSILDALGPATRVVSVFSMPPFPIENFRYQSSLGGGALNDLGPYAVATSRYFLREQPRRLNCSILQSHPNTGIDLSFTISAQYSNGKSLIANYGFDTEYQNFIRAFGSQVAISVERAYTPPPDRKNKISVLSNDKHSNISIPPADSFELAIQNMLKAAETKKFNHYYKLLLSDAEMLETMRNSALANI